VLTQISQVKEATDASQQVRLRDVVVEIERVEELVMSAIQSTHHDDSLPSFDVFQDTQHSASTTTFSIASADLRHRINASRDQKPPWKLNTGFPCYGKRIAA
jgi:hypothetical protein